MGDKSILIQAVFFMIGGIALFLSLRMHSSYLHLPAAIVCLAVGLSLTLVFFVKVPRWSFFPILIGFIVAEVVIPLSLIALAVRMEKRKRKIRR